MFYFQITKYNPELRNEKGYYPVGIDWIGIDDIGRKFNGKILTEEEYLRVENAYVESILMLMKLEHVKEFIVFGLVKSEIVSLAIPISKELQDAFDHLKNQDKISISVVPHIIRLILREFMWCKLIAPTMEIYFGDDYYMFVALTIFDQNVINKIQELGLFVEATYDIFR